MTDFEIRERVRSATYRTLARLFEPPTPTLQSDAVLERGVELLEAVNPTAAEHAGAMHAALESEGLERIRRDHIALFVGPTELGAPPYGSVYLDGQRSLMGPSTIDLERLLALAGLKKADALRDAPDHVRVELDAMHVVVERTVDAIAAQEFDRAQDLIRVQAALLQNHFSRWVTPFAKALRESAATEYHRQLADLLEAFVRQEFTEDVSAMIDEFHALRPVTAA
jgi:putative dimethyl sulfoxide reductase chaperone